MLMLTLKLNKSQKPQRGEIFVARGVSPWWKWWGQHDFGGIVAFFLQKCWQNLESS